MKITVTTTTHNGVEQAHYKADGREVGLIRGKHLEAAQEALSIAGHDPEALRCYHSVRARGYIIKSVWGEA